MEGGAMRGMFTAGVTDVMMEHDVTFDGAIGVSAGAVFGCNLKSRQPGRVIRYNVAYCKNPHYAGFHTLIKTGDIFGEQFCYHDIPERLDPFDLEAYRNNPMEFYAVATDVMTGKAVYQRVDECDETGLLWLRASASLPLLSNIVEVSGYSLLDGGPSDSIPLRYFEEIGYDRNVLILTRPLEYRKAKDKTLPMARLALRRYPKLLEAMETRHERYNETVEYVIEQEKKENIFVIRPPKPIEVSAVERDRNRLLEAYRMGRRVMEERLSDVREFLR